MHGSALVSYSAGISACEKGGQWQWALALFGEMWEANMQPDIICTPVPGAVRPVGPPPEAGP